jgi:hypothetical protein
MSSERLLPLYLATDYQVLAPGGAFTFHIDEYSEALAAAHRANGVECSAFLTAWNPRGQQTDALANHRAQQSLLAMLEQHPLPWWPGSGIDPTNRWPAEDSALVFGMEAALALRIGSIFDQSAVVVTAANAVPRLLWL